MWPWSNHFTYLALSLPNRITRSSWTLTWYSPIPRAVFASRQPLPPPPVFRALPGYPTSLQLDPSSKEWAQQLHPSPSPVRSLLPAWLLKLLPQHVSFLIHPHLPCNYSLSLSFKPQPTRNHFPLKNPSCSEWAKGNMVGPLPCCCL